MTVYRHCACVFSLTLALTSFFVSSTHAEMLSWTQRSANAGHNGYVGGTVDAPQLQLAWDVPLGFSQSGTGSWAERAVATDGESVYRVALSGYAPSGDYHVMSFDIHDGSLNWDTTIKGNAFEGVGEPTIAGGKVWVNRAGHSSSGGSANLPKLYALSPTTGNVLSTTSYAAQWGENDRPTSDGQVLIAQSGYYGGMSNYRVSDGGTNWAISGPQSARPLAALNNQFVFAYGDDVYSRSTGNLVDTTLHPTSKPLSYPTISPGGLLIYRTSDGIAAFDAATRQFDWDLDLGTAIRGLAVGNNVIAAVTPTKVVFVDESTGLFQREYTSLSGFLGSDIAMTDQHVFLQRGSTTIAVNIATGQEVWQVDDSGELAMGDNYLFLSDHAGIRAYAVPEPSTVILLTMALSLVIFSRGRHESL